MIFEYTSKINIDECDMDRICNDVKNGRDFCDAFDDALSGYDDCDYYHMGDIYDDVKEEIERRIKESEKEKTEMKVNYTRTITKDINITKLVDRISDIICDCLYDEIGTSDFTDEDYETIQPIINACTLAVGKELVKKYSTIEH